MKSKFKRIKNPLGFEVELWNYESCFCEIGFSDEEKWATIYQVFSEKENQGHCQQLLRDAKKHYEDKGFRFGGSIALNEKMSYIYKKLGIKEYKDLDL